jgi:hypothetical protein
MATLASYRGTDFVEMPDSPAYHFGEKPTLTRRWRGTYAQIIAQMPAIGSVDGSWTVRSVDPQKQPGDQGMVSVTYEGTGAGVGDNTLPADEADLQGSDMSPRLERHPRYAPITEAGMKLVRTAVDSPEQALADAALAELSGSALALELIEKLLRGQETYYLASYTYTWTSFSWTFPVATPAGKRQAPLGPYAAYLAPLTGAGWSWLRVADNVYGTGMYRTTRVWMGAPGGHWDEDIYELL